jgi:LmbE family N-acetylglucosaminyl deacetylase
VAHPDDETLWAGGLILMNTAASWLIAAACRKSDPDRAPRFFKALQGYGASGAMADLDDGPDQNPLPLRTVQDAILELLPVRQFDLVITHGPKGEYTRHIRHEETGRAVTGLWENGELSAGELWTFAYEDGGGTYPPRPAPDADLTLRLPPDIWQRKYAIITDTYGFAPDSFEASAACKSEAFRRFKERNNKS